MLDKIKEISSQVATKTTDAVKTGYESLADSAGAMTGALNEKAVRTSIAQMCTVIEVALQEVKNRPLAQRRISLTATVNIGVASLELQVYQNPDELPIVERMQVTEVLPPDA